MQKLAFLLSCFCFLSLASEEASSLAKAEYSTAKEVEPSSFVNKSINAITGSFYHVSKDISVPGPFPLDVYRYCNSEITSYEFLGRGMSTNYPCWLKGDDSNFDDYLYAVVQDDGGSVLRYVSKFKRHMKLRLDPDVVQNGLTNCGSYEISARTNLKNTAYEIELDKDQDGLEGRKWTGYMPDGSVRKYKKPNHYDHVSRLESERKPNGLKLYYDYHHHEISKIELRDSESKQELNWLKFDHSDSGRLITITASNGRKVQYKMKEKFHQDKFQLPEKALYVERVESTDAPTSSYDYKKINGRLYIERISWPNGRFLENDYDSKGRVIAQKAPTGKNGEKRTIYELDYRPHDHSTKVTDAIGRKSLYRYSSSKRLTAIENYLNNNLYKKERFYWGEKSHISKGDRDESTQGNLIAKAICNSYGKALFLKNFRYDNYGNITKDELYGNLTGLSTHSIPLTYDGRPDEKNLECYRKYFTYTNDRFHLRTSESEDAGPTIKYHYKPGTDLITAKFTCNGEEIRIREFFEYDDRATLIHSIIDNGTSTDPDNLKNVTERRITTIIPVKGTKSHGVGQPATIIESYLDIKTRRKITLKRRDFTYDTAGHIKTETVTDPNRNILYTLKYSHNGMGKLVHHFNAEGQEYKYDYDENGNKTKDELVGSGYYTTYAYDKMNRLIEEAEHHSDGDVFKTTYEYDLVGNLISTTDHFGAVTYFVYDDLNRLVKTIYPEVTYEVAARIRPTVTKEYDIFDNVVAETDENGHTTRYTYNIRNQPVTIIYPDGSEERFRYNLNGTLHAKCDKTGTITTYTYDFLKRVTKAQVHDNQGNHLHTLTNEYGSFHLISSTDAMGYKTTFEYDGAGRLVKESKVDGSAFSRKTYEYDALSRVISEKQWFGESEKDFVATNLSYDKLNRIVAESKQNGTGELLDKVQYAYDVHGNKTEVTSFKDNHISFTHKTLYDSHSEPIQITDECGNITKIFVNYRHKSEYQRVLQKTTTDPLFNKTIETYDALSRLRRIQKYNAQNKLLADKSIIYDRAGNIIRETERVVRDGAITRTYVIERKYDELDRVIKLTEQPGTDDQKCTLYSYYKSGLLKTVTKPDGITLDHTYDTLGRLIHLTSSDGTIFYNYHYDQNNNPTEVYDNILKLSHWRSFDAWNRVTKETFLDGIEVSLTYDALGRPTQFVLPDKSSVAYSYAGGTLQSVIRRNAKNNELYRHNYNSFDLRQNVLQSELIVSSLAQFDHDAKGRNVKIETSYFKEEIPQDGFDKAGNLLRYCLQDSVGSIDANFAYDDLYQLTKESGIQEHSYENDSLSNRVQYDGKEQCVDNLNKLISTAEASYSYDKNGNLVSKTENSITTLFRYDALSRLIEVEEPNNFKARYFYDSLNRRIGKLLSTWDRGTWKESALSRFIYQGMREVGSINANSKLSEFRMLGLGKKAEIGATVSLELDGKTYCPVHDHRGNISSFIDFTSKEVSETRRYTTFGEMEMYDDESDILKKSTIGSPWGFVSKRLDDETGFIYFGRRYYDPKTGRWITPDPLDFADGSNLYAYVHNNPLVLVDPYGLLSENEPTDPEATKNDLKPGENDTNRYC